MLKRGRSNTTIAEELDKELINNNATSEVILDSTRMLMSPEAAAKREIMKSLGWDSNLKRAENLISIRKERDEFSQFDNVYSIGEIEKIAKAYDLKFMKAEYFKCPNSREDELGDIINEFMSQNNIEYSRHEKAKLYILCDQSYFKSRKSDIDQDLGILIFYQPERNSDFFIKVGSFGEGKLTFNRYYKGWKNSSSANKFIHNFIVGFGVALMPMAFIVGFGASVAASMLAGALYALISVRHSFSNGELGINSWREIEGINKGIR